MLIVVPYQTNGWDCGVFVCRYAYGFKCIQSQQFSYQEIGFQDAPKKHESWLNDLISSKDAFRFGDSEISSLRKDMKVLIERLHKVYGPWSKEQKRKRKSDKECSKKTTDTTGRFEDLTPSAVDIENEGGGANHGSTLDSKRERDKAVDEGVVPSETALTDNGNTASPSKHCVAAALLHENDETCQESV